MRLGVAACRSEFHGVWRRDRDYRQYRCPNSKPEAAERCNCPRIIADDVEFVVWETIGGLLSDPAHLEVMASDYLALRAIEQQPTTRPPQADLARKIKPLETTLASKVEEYLKAGIEARAVNAATRALERRAPRTPPPTRLSGADAHP